MYTKNVKIDGMTCPACTKLVSMYLKKKIEGVSDVQIDLKTGATNIESDRKIADNQIEDALSGTEFKLFLENN